MNGILEEILEQLKQINEKLSWPVVHTYDSIKPGEVYCTTTNDPMDYQERFQAKTNL